MELKNKNKFKKNLDAKDTMNPFLESAIKILRDASPEVCDWLKTIALDHEKYRLEDPKNNDLSMKTWATWGDYRMGVYVMSNIENIKLDIIWKRRIL